MESYSRERSSIEFQFRRHPILAWATRFHLISVNKEDKFSGQLAVISTVIEQNGDNGSTDSIRNGRRSSFWAAALSPFLR